MMSWEIVTKTEAANHARLPSTTIQDFWYDVAIDAVRRWQGIYWIGSSESVLTVTNEKHNGNGTPAIKLRWSPIVSVSSVTIDNVVWPSDSFSIDYSHGIIGLYDGTPEKGKFNRGIGNVIISYSAGSDDVSAIIKLALLQIIAYCARNYEHFGSDANLKYASASGQKIGAESPPRQSGLHSAIKRILTDLLGAKQNRFGY
jgi:hypothetical protein